MAGRLHLEQQKSHSTLHLQQQQSYITRHLQQQQQSHNTCMQLATALFTQE
jgi:hypothetical protein